jgi:hypothetical protein
MGSIDGQGVLPVWRWSWDDAIDLTDASGWALMTENGFGSVIAFIAGPGRFGRRPANDEGRTVRIIEERPDGSSVEYTRPFTSEDRDSIEESAGWYIADWGMPPRPAGFDWFVRLPAGETDAAAFERRLTGRMIDLAQFQELPGTVVAAELYRGIDDPPVD